MTAALSSLLSPSHPRIRLSYPAPYRARVWTAGPDALNSRYAMLAFLFFNAFVISFIYSLSTGTAREISWQDFKVTYLESGRVSKVVVVNRRTARVYVKGVDGHDSA